MTRANAVRVAECDSEGGEHFVGLSGSQSATASYLHYTLQSDTSTSSTQFCEISHYEMKSPT